MYFVLKYLTYRKYKYTTQMVLIELTYEYVICDEKSPGPRKVNVMPILSILG